MTSAKSGGRGTAPSIWTPAVVLLAVFIALISVSIHVRVPLLPEMASDLDLDPAVASGIIVAFGLGRVIADIPAGYLADRYTPRNVLVVCTLILVAGSVVFALSTNLAMAMTGSVITGIVSGLVTGTAQTVLGRSVEANQRATALSVFTISLHVGASLGPLLGGYIGDAFGWATALMAAAGVAVFAIVPPLLIRAGGPPASRGGGAGMADLAPLTWPTRLGISALPFAVFFVSSALPNVLIPYIGRDSLGLTAGDIGLMLATGGLVRIAGGFFFGYLADRVSRHAAIVPSFVLMAVATLLLALPPSLWLLWVSVAILMFSVSTIGAAAALLADRVPLHRYGRATGMFRLIGDVGMLAGPLLAGVLYDTAGTTITALVLTGCVVALLGYFLATVRRGRS